MKQYVEDMGVIIVNKIKALFPEGVETITISKNDYDRLYGELTYKNIMLEKENNRLNKIINELENQVVKLSEQVSQYQDEIFERDNNWYDMQD